MVDRLINRGSGDVEGGGAQPRLASIAAFNVNQKDNWPDVASSYSARIHSVDATRIFGAAVQLI